ncbi:MAG: LTA synthase family protein [Mediterranea sp.]|jgi:phosphoglycerol transferase MdoB-like AlkP superfamily enzyme|nr:LTA synthase family protein [Mediterranea sp.]
MRKLLVAYRYILSVHVLALIILLAIRLILLIGNYSNVEDDADKLYDITWAFLYGVWFDNVIACYISILPVVIVSFYALINRQHRISTSLIQVCGIYYCVMFALMFAVSVADIPYFGYFFKHIDCSVMNWKEEGTEAVSMIFRDLSYYLYFVVLILFVALFSWLVISWGRRLSGMRFAKPRLRDYTVTIPLTALAITLCIVGMRGRLLGMKPLRTSLAFFSNNPFINQMGINPTFYLINDIRQTTQKHRTVRGTPSDEASVRIMQSYLGIDTTGVVANRSPFARRIVPADSLPKLNVVLVLMESMSMNYLQTTTSDGSPLTPFLNDVAARGCFFDHFYSTGTHTNQGVLATLCGYPSLFDKNAMKTVRTPAFDGLATILKANGYHTLFFLTHEPQYDNMQAFIKTNDFEEFYSQDDYPAKEAYKPFGVSDGFLFDYAFHRLSTVGQSRQPFFSVILTISNHPPYNSVPADYPAIGKSTDERAVSYADRCIQTFMEKASHEPWYDHTLFVFLGDHGRVIGRQAYELPLSLVHVPFILYSPAWKDEARQCHQPGGQIDVFPTLLGRLGIDYTNHSPGVDLFDTTRRFVQFSSDNLLGCIDREYLYIYSPDSRKQSLFRYADGSVVDVVNEHPQLADSMYQYAASQLNATEYLYEEDKVR